MRPNTDIRVILVEREYSGTEPGVFGRLYINGTYFCDTLENRHFAVPCGLYQVDYTYSPKFDINLPLFFDRGKYGPDRGFRFHPGNSPEDSNGCILLGERYYNKSGTITKKLKSSREWTERLCNILERDDPGATKTVLVIASI